MLLLLFAAWLQLIPISDSTQIRRYQCPPCGCEADGHVHSGPGTCESCQMPLVPIESATAIHIDQSIGPLFNDGALGIFYPKLIYPVFVISILMGLALFWKFLTHKKTMDPFLTLFILVIASYGFKNQIYGVDNGITNNPYYLYLPISWIVAIGPLIWLHVNMVIQKDRQLKRRWTYHFLPAGMIWLGYFVLAIGPDSWRTRLMITPFETAFSHLEQIIALMLGWGYWYLAFRSYRIWSGVASNHVKHKKWLRTFLLTTGSLLSVWSMIISLNIGIYKGGITTLTYNPLWLAIFFTILVVTVAFLRDSKFFFSNGYQWPDNVNAWSNHPVEQQLEDFMQSEKPYLDPELSLNKLAQQTGINSKLLSATLNKGVGQNFYDYVNGYRIDEVKKLLLNQENKNLTIEAMANMAGFKSKSSFNMAFKKVTQMTPREFLKHEQAT
ncbi:MAG: helix-turn-helix domain-containing protein [Cytophagales bacterium]|nr:helix-turn-helix domain-containing protein [Cytophagales bacterium]